VDKRLLDDIDAILTPSTLYAPDDEEAAAVEVAAQGGQTSPDKSIVHSANNNGVWLFEASAFSRERRAFGCLAFVPTLLLLQLQTNTSKLFLVWQTSHIHVGSADWTPGPAAACRANLSTTTLVVLSLLDDDDDEDDDDDDDEGTGGLLLPASARWTAVSSIAIFM
jgi:hypothetical protein